MNHTETSFNYFLSQLSEEEKRDAMESAEYYRRVLIEGLGDEDNLEY